MKKEDIKRMLELIIQQAKEELICLNLEEFDEDYDLNEDFMIARCVKMFYQDEVYTDSI